MGNRMEQLASRRRPHRSVELRISSATVMGKLLRNEQRFGRALDRDILSLSPLGRRGKMSDIALAKEFEGPSDNRPAPLGRLPSGKDSG